MTFLKKNRIQIDKNVARLETGLETLAKAAKDTEVLGGELKIENEKISKKSAEVAEILEEVKKNSAEAEVKKADAAQKEAELSIKSE